jgi:hypothetical protein
MTRKEVVMDQALREALEEIQRELRKIELYGQAAEDNLARLQGTLAPAQRADVDRLDHSIERLHALTKVVQRALEVTLRAGVLRDPAPTPG